MSVEAMKKAVCDHVDALGNLLLDVSHRIHANPELAFEEVHAAAALCEAIESEGHSVERGAWGLATAFDATVLPGPGPTLAFLSEYDALPDIGHACGHNIIATASLGAALALGRLGTTLPATVRLIGTPAEERGGGKEIMARNGAFEGVDLAMMVHPAGYDLATMPCICIAEVEVAYHGKPAHASAMPHDGINALDALITAYQAIAQLRQHIRQTERLHGIITHGGGAPNIVPDFAAGRFYVRAAEAVSLEVLKRRVEGCFRAGAEATGARLELTWGAVDYLDLRTNWPLARAYQANAESLGRVFRPMESLPPGMAGSTDMGNVSHRVPSIHPMIAAAPAHCVIHHPEFARWSGSELGDKAVLDGAKALAMTAVDYVLDQALRERVADNFAKVAA